MTYREVTILYKEALNILFKGEKNKKGSCLYNIACIQALTGEKDKAIVSLISSIRTKLN